MNEYPHVRDTGSEHISRCRCGVMQGGEPMTSQAVVTVRPSAWPTGPAPQTWGSACPAAMRERIAELEAERDKAREEASAAAMAAAVGESVVAALNGEPVSDFMQSFGPVMEAQTIRSLLELERRDTAVLWRAVKDACAYLHVTDDDEADWPKLPMYAKDAAEEIARLRAVGPRWERVAGTFDLMIGTYPLASVYPENGKWGALTKGRVYYFDTLPSAARAVCERLGLPVILDGLPEGGGE